MRTINHIVVHCTGSSPDATIEAILNYWKKERGWKTPGYHYIVKRNGEIVNLLPEEKVSNGVKGHNADSVHISYIGGIDKHGNPLDNRTPAQIQSLFNKIIELSEKYPKADILGHRDFPGVTKRCPSFDVKEWLKNHTPDVAKAA